MSWVPRGAVILGGIGYCGSKHEPLILDSGSIRGIDPYAPCDIRRSVRRLRRRGARPHSHGPRFRRLGYLRNASVRRRNGDARAGPRPPCAGPSGIRRLRLRARSRCAVDPRCARMRGALWTANRCRSMDRRGARSGRDSRSARPRRRSRPRPALERRCLARSAAMLAGILTTVAPWLGLAHRSPFLQLTAGAVLRLRCIAVCAWRHRHWPHRCTRSHRSREFRRAVHRRHRRPSRVVGGCDEADVQRDRTAYAVLAACHARSLRINTAAASFDPRHRRSGPTLGMPRGAVRLFLQ